MEYSRDPDQIAKDIEELQHLLPQATRDHTKKLLQTEIKTLQTTKLLVNLIPYKYIQIEQSQPKKLDEINKDQISQAKEDKDYIKKESLVYSQIQNYGWDQEGDIVKVYLTSGFEGIGKHQKQNIDCEFTDNSLDLRILDFNNKNFRLKINPLNGIIDPANCKLKVKSNSIVLELKKAKSKHWDDIKEKKGGLGTSSDVKKKGEDDSKDSGDSLMNMMKNLYETGDEQMKRTIAESWQKTQQDKLGGNM